MSLRGYSPRLCVLALFVFTAVAVRAQSAPPADLDEYVARAMKTFDVPGMALAIVKDGNVVVAKGYGVRKLGEATPVSKHTLFGTAPNTTDCHTPDTAPA